ncbi:MAG: SpoIID/LytB domain-containing protein [Lachnospiraceae bacterium]|nr:SpoIID/LytB domain-containing protein [Lachnospiraceae bacterium]
MKKRRKSLVAFIILLVLVLFGVVGGLLIENVFYEKVGHGTMTNEEANRLISYLGINDYEYSDRVASAFTVGDAKDLLDSAGVSYDKVDIQLDYVPGFVPLTKKQFETLYSAMIVELELDRLSSVSLYIYNIDSANEQEIDGIIYEVVNTSAGDYYMEKEYGMDHAYIGKVVKLYVSNNEIILCQGETEEEVVLRNAYVSKRTTNDEGSDVMLVYISGAVYELPVNKAMTSDGEQEEFLCDVTITNDGITKLTSHTKELVETKVTSYSDGILTADGFEGELYLSDAFNVYRVSGVMKATQSAGTLIGYEKVSLYVKDDIVEAALVTEDIYAKNIRVLLNNSDYTDYYHSEVTVTSDTDFTVSFGETVNEYKAGDSVQFRNGSEELKNGKAIIQSKVQDGKMQLTSLSRQGGKPAYRGKLELSRDDKGVMVINELSVEEYLYAVVPSEMPVTYEMEALKAQAICARAYAYRQMEDGKLSSYGAHLDDSVSSQVYNNVGEDERGNYAVDDTYGVVPCYDNEVIEAFFFSTSCGTTSSNSSVWGGYQKPYLLDAMQTELNDLANMQSEENFRMFIDGELGTGFLEEEEPFFRWTVEFTAEQLTEAVNANLYNRIQAMPEYVKVLDAKGDYVKKDIATIGDVVNIEVTKRGDSGIIEEMIITGSEETIWVKGQTNARALLSPANTVIRKQDGSTVSGWQSLPSAYYYVDCIAGDGEVFGSFVIYGGGFGHGVGMSQNGANNMAKLGYTAKDIIGHYYTAVELKDMYELMGK